MCFRLKKSLSNWQKHENNKNSSTNSRFTCEISSMQLILHQVKKVACIFSRRRNSWQPFSKKFREFALPTSIRATFCTSRRIKLHNFFSWIIVWKVAYSLLIKTAILYIFKFSVKLSMLGWISKIHLLRSDGKLFMHRYENSCIPAPLQARVCKTWFELPQERNLFYANESEVLIKG